MVWCIFLGSEVGFVVGVDGIYKDEGSGHVRLSRTRTSAIWEIEASTRYRLSLPT